MAVKVLEEGFQLYKRGVDYQYGKANNAMNLYLDAMANLSIVASLIEEIQESEILNGDEYLPAYDATVDALDSLHDGITKLAYVGHSLSTIKNTIHDIQMKENRS